MNAFLTFLVNQIVDRLFEGAPQIEDLGDILIGDNGNNNLQVGDQDDILLGGNDSDVILGGAGTDFVFAGAGHIHEQWFLDKLYANDIKYCILTPRTAKALEQTIEEEIQAATQYYSPKKHSFALNR